ncbi:MAG: hypothetical protein QOG19_1340 [Mycobacterium sp.]|jgi:hypothetical protein|nr:hypothetical protein [Mycobacterium sp.]MDT5223933.1 hypothetical protein [Mycobacterium sp.]
MTRAAIDSPTGAAGALPAYRATEVRRILDPATGRVVETVPPEQGADGVDAAIAALGLIAVIGLTFARETRGEPLPTDASARPIHRIEKCVP